MAKTLRQAVRRRGTPIHASGAHQSIPVDAQSRLPLIEEAAWPSVPAILNSSTGETINRFITDIENSEALSKNGLLSRFGLMLSGPPGTGKTLLAGHISSRLNKRFFIVRLDSLISSRLGETAKNIRQIFDYAPTQDAVLLLDELDAIAKIRDDKQEIGELKRIVNTVIQGLDSLSENAIVVAATNHARLLDPAIWRRFPYQCEVALPDDQARSELWMHYVYCDNRKHKKRCEVLSAMSSGFSGADIENVALATRRLAVLNQIDLPEPQLLRALLRSSPPNLVFPELVKLRSTDNEQIACSAIHHPGVEKSTLASMLKVTRQTIHNYITGCTDVRLLASE
ncbi:AAA family ATPase [Methylobacterium fujisawaense]|uniref:AAA family ATPase n=1 Tax=Methylobacterium fujisawaense TaxID=107400 RepID=UPI003CF5CA23